MMPFEPSEISGWANRPDANHQLPELIRRLILATVPELSWLEMPSGSAVWLSGWDGQLKAKTGNAWVPKGSSVWELSCRSDVGTKANDDYGKRTEAPQGVPDATATFVFVTARQWNGKEQWAEARRGDGKWADVRAYDANNLIAWLGQAPAVTEWFGGVLGKLPSDGYTTLDERWENWATVTEPNIGPSLVVAGRQDSTDRLSEWIQQTPSAYYVQAQTREEAIAFVAASARNSDVAWGAALLARALVVKSEDAWNSLVRHTSPLVLIRAFDGNVSSQVATGRGHHVITPLHANEEPRGNGDQLPMLGRDETVSALTEMGLSETEARALVRKTARSLPIMRRFLIEEAGGPIPAWAFANPQSPLPSLMLVGQWDESNEHDKGTIAQITGCPYEDVARVAAALAQTEDSPLTKVGSRWRFLSHEEAWHLLAPRLIADDVARFTEEAVRILGTESSEYELPVEQRHLAGIQGKGVPHSRLLREGIVRTLTLMGNQGERAQNVDDVTHRPAMVLRQVLTDDKGWEIWATLSGDLATLAEADPETVLEAIERRLSATPSSFEDLFHQEGDPLFGGAQHTGLLWALERLTWSPEYFSRVAVILARLAQTDPGGRVSNRPAESLQAMFLPWFRVSEAPDSQRLQTLGALLARVPQAGWRTLVDAFPTGHDFAVGREPPLWRPWGQDGVPRPTWLEIHDSVKEMERLLLEHVGEDADRWKDIVGLISDLSPDARQQATDLMAQRVNAIKQHQNSTDLWVSLRTELNRHRSFPDANWAIPETYLQPLAVIYEGLTPDDPAAAYGWLFGGWPDLPDGSDEGNLEVHRAKVDASRQSAIVAAYSSGDIKAILSIAESAEQPWEVGRAFIIGIGAEPALELALTYAGSEQGPYRLMIRGILWTLFQQSGWPALDELLERAKATDATPPALADVFLATPADRDTWMRLDNETSQVQRHYWEAMNPWSVPREDEADVAYVFLKLLEVHRSPAAAEWASNQSIHHEIVIRTLDQLPADLAVGAAAERGSNMLIHGINNLLEKLDKSEAVDDSTIARLELPFIAVLSQDSRRELALHREISRDPALFADLIALMYRRDDGESDDDANEQAARVAGSILMPIMMGERGIIPGRTEQGVVDYEVLTTWINEARRLSADRGRGEVGDNFIGQLLSKAPAGEDGIWPCEPVRELLELLDSRYIGNGFATGTHNQRGVTSRGVFDGGDQERTLSGGFRRQANEIGARWPTTAGLLRRIAESYESDAQWHDRDAEERDRFGF